MKIYRKLYEDLELARYDKDRERVVHISTLIGEIQRSPSKDKSDVEVMKIIKTLLKHAESVKAMVNDVNITEIRRKQLKTEHDQSWIDLLSEYTPKQATLIEIEKYIETLDLDEYKGNLMRAIGGIIKHFNGNADGKLVKTALSSVVAKRSKSNG